jgi:DNA primase
MALSPQFLDELRARTPLSEVVGRTVKLVRAGREMKGCCPFHNEKTPSFYVNDAKGFFHCFGCGAHGDAIGFAMRAHGLSFPEAVERLAADAGMEVPRPDPEDRRRWERQKTLHDLLERACRWFEEQLRAPAGREALAYLGRRGLGGRVAERWRLGYAPADAGALRKAMAAEGWSDDDMVEAGLLKRPDDGRSPYAFFRDRVLFPVADPRGRVVAFGGRLLSGEGPKYVNSADGPLFHKGRLLYNLSRARGAAADGRPFVVAEGYVDVIALAEAGIDGAVAPLGTALTETQVEVLWKAAPAGNRVPILCFDGDAAGRRAAFRAADRVLPLLRPDHSVRFVFLPDGLDPDDLVRERGADAMREALEGARPLADVLWSMETEGRDLSTPEARAGLKASCEERVRRIADRDVQSFYRREMLDRLDALFGRGPRGGAPSPGGSRQRARGPGPWDPAFRRLPPAVQRSLQRWGANPPSRVLTAERPLDEGLLLATLVNHPSLFDEVGDLLAGARFSTPRLEDLRRDLVAALASAPDLDPLLLRRHLCGLDHGASLDELFSADTYRVAANAHPDAPRDLALRVWRDAWEQGQARRRRLEELREAGRLEPAEVTEPNVRRIAALKREIEAASRLDDEDFIPHRRPSGRPSGAPPAADGTTE